MIYKKILVPFDGSDPAKGALEAAKKLIADDPESTLYVISVIPDNYVDAWFGSRFVSPDDLDTGASMLYADNEFQERMSANARLRAEEELQEGIGEALDGVGFDVKADVVVANKASSGIVDYATEQGAEIIVMGRRGLGALRGMLGSVSYAVLHEADIPVLTVK